MDILILRLDAPILSFGAPAIDRHGVIQPYPALSMITGLLGNALGYDHTDFEQLNRLQERLRYAVREDRSGRQLQDYQTVDLSKPYMRKEVAWTTHGYIEERKGGAASTGTHERYRYYWADGVYTIALTLVPDDETPTPGDLERCIKYPERPLFIGRKTCLPSTPLFVEKQEENDLMEALKKAEYSPRTNRKTSFRSWWQVSQSDYNHTDEITITPAVDQRDWANQIHVSERWITQGELPKNYNTEGSDDAPSN